MVELRGIEPLCSKTFPINHYKLSINNKTITLNTRYWNFRNNYNVVLTIPFFSNDVLAK